MQDAFSGLDGVAELVIPEGVEYIGQRAFKYWDKLEYVKIPDSVNYIDFYAFDACENLLKAKFVDTGGWKVQNRGGAVTEISPADLSAIYTAARYLTETYNDYEWIKE